MKVFMGKYPGSRSKKERKISVRIDNYDVWNLAENLALIIHPALLRLQETKHGSPYTDDEDVPDNLKSTNAPPKENEWDTDEFHLPRWEWILNEMIWAFGQLNIDWESQFWTGEFDMQFVEIPGENLFQMVDGPNHTAVHDKEGSDAHYERIKNGLRLFGKYYLALWD